MSRQDSGQVREDHVHNRQNCAGSFTSLAAQLSDHMSNPPNQKIALRTLSNCLKARLDEAQRYGNMDAKHWAAYYLIKNLEDCVYQIPKGETASFEFYTNPNRFFVTLGDEQVFSVYKHGWRQEAGGRRRGRTLRRKVRRSTHRTKR